tara:strand:- start:180 stop:548 length:369 start_codon:yes stop_codon:yes gene_type:complete
MKRIILPVVLLVTLFFVNCGTPEFRNMRSICKSIWLDKIPAKYAQQNYMKQMSRQVPSGNITCYSYGTNNRYTNCKESKKTEYYSVPAVRTVDLNSSRRNAKIKACAINKCINKYGNGECET